MVAAAMWPLATITVATYYTRSQCGHKNWTAVDDMVLTVTSEQKLNFSELLISYKTFATIRYDTRCYFNVRSKANMSRLNLPHGNDN